MPTIHSLPIELLIPILEKASHSIRVDCDLALLSVCQAWRWIVARRVYSTVSIHSSRVYEDERGPLKGYYYDKISTPSLKVGSRFQLAKDNGMLDLVTQLKIYDGLSNDDPGLLVNVMNVISSGTDSLPCFDDVRKRYIAYISKDSTYTNLGDALQHDAKVLARHVASVLPNIRSICFDGGQCHDCASLFFAELVKSYETQLTSLECRAKDCFTDPVLAHQLKLLDISLYKATESRLLKIDPAPIERLNIKSWNLKSCWRIFTQTRDGSIRFDNLKALYFQHRRWNDELFIPTQTSHANEGMSLVIAPELEHLTVNNNLYEFECAEWLAQSPLQLLVFNGHAHNALQLCNLLNYPLRRLKLHSFIIRSAANSGFVQTINQIMSKMQCAQHVACTFEGNDHLDLTDLNWPNLTQLNLCVPMDFSELVSKLPKMPALVVLELSLEVYYGDDATSAARFLKQLRNIYSEPIQSCIEEFYLIAGDDDDDDENSALVECFISAEDDLKWLLPKLKALYVGYS